MQTLIAKLNEANTHHSILDPADTRDKMLTNLRIVEEEQSMMNSDLNKVADFIKKLLQKQSINHRIHKDKLRRKKSYDEVAASMATPKNKQTEQRPPSAKQDEDITLFNEFGVNQLVHLSSLYLFSLINKYMEMHKLSQRRQYILHKKTLRIYREETSEQLENMTIRFLADVRQSKDRIKELEDEVESMNRENRRLTDIVASYEESSN